MYLTVGQNLTNKENDNTYEIIEELGSGGYGNTYLVHDHNFNRKAVIKCIETHTTETNVINQSQKILKKEVIS